MDRYNIALEKKTVGDRLTPSKSPLIRKIITGSLGTGKTRRLLDEIRGAPGDKGVLVSLRDSDAYIQRLIECGNSLSLQSWSTDFMHWDISSGYFSQMWEEQRMHRYQNIYLDSIDFQGAKSTIGILYFLASVGIPKIVVNCDIRSLQEALGYITQKTFSRHISVRGVKWDVDNLIIPDRKPGSCYSGLDHY